MHTLIRAVLFLLLASPVVGAVVNTECYPTAMSLDGSEWVQTNCTIWTDDAGAFVVSITTDVARMRVNADGSIRSTDRAGMRTAVQNAYRAAVAAKRDKRVAEVNLETKRRNAAMTLTPAQVE